MQIKYNPSGTHVYKDQLKIRLDMYPSEVEKSYARNYVYVPVYPEGGYPGKRNEYGFPLDREDYRKWLDGLPHIWQLNPCLSVLVAVDTAITKVRLSEFCEDVFKPDVLATVDNIATLPGSSHLVSPYMRQKTTLATSKLAKFDDADRQEIDGLLKVFSFSSSVGKSEDVKPQSIDIGAGADGMNDLMEATNIMCVTQTNPANEAGNIDTVQIQASSNMTGVKVGTFSGAGSLWDDRDYETLGDVPSGSIQHFTGLSIATEIGDTLGTYNNGGYMGVRDAEGTLSTVDNDRFGSGAVTYTNNYLGYAACVYGTGSSGKPSMIPILIARGLL